MWQEGGGSRWCEVAVGAAWVMGFSGEQDMFNILQSINDTSDYHKFFSALQATFQVKQEGGDQFHRYKLRNCVAILHSMVCGLAILRVLCTRLANATS